MFMFQQAPVIIELTKTASASAPDISIESVVVGWFYTPIAFIVGLWVCNVLVAIGVFLYKRARH
ncbi:MAG TPA: hypothetical protein VI485_26090 [Vicinamibacterales bacterium]|nr:hypothetical protein [Vicinamibacterales bacterium]